MGASDSTPKYQWRSYIRPLIAIDDLLIGMIRYLQEFGENFKKQGSASEAPSTVGERVKY